MLRSHSSAERIVCSLLLIISRLETRRDETRVERWGYRTQFPEQKQLVLPLYSLDSSFFWCREWGWNMSYLLTKKKEKKKKLWTGDEERNRHTTLQSVFRSLDLMYETVGMTQGDGNCLQSTCSCLGECVPFILNFSFCQLGDWPCRSCWQLFALINYSKGL